MTFSELTALIYDIESRPSRLSVIFGCDCGCGGDSYTSEEWELYEDRADEAIGRLEAIGITFDDQS